MDVTLPALNCRAVHALPAMCALVLLLAGPRDAAAQGQRRGKAAAETFDRTIAFPEPEMRCSAAYHDALAHIMADATHQPLATLKRMHTAMPGLKGYWLFQEGGERRRQRDAQNRIVDGDKVCEEQISRAGRVKCLRWEARAPEPPREPPVPPPPMTQDEQRLLKHIAEFVQNRGAPPEFLSNGKYTIMSDRVAADLEGYLAQPAHPALCAGAVEFLEFLDDQLPLLRKRAGDVADLPPQALRLTAERIALLKQALATPPQPATLAATPVVAASAAEAGPMAPLPETKPVASALQAAIEVAALTLSPAEAAAVAAEHDALSALARAAATLGSEAGSPLAPAKRAEARAAFRTVELAAYAELLAARYQDLDAGLFGKIAAARRAHAATCSCNGQ